LSIKQPLVINGWNIFAHPLFLNQVEDLLVQIETLRQTHPQDYQKKNATKRLIAISRLIFEVIPQDPARNDYRQGNTLGKEYKHWFRAKFFQQYRLFFRYHQESRVIVFVWVNDERSKRAYDSNTDAYLVFRKMLESGNPPDDWNKLLKDAQAVTDRLDRIIKANLE
jgi:toxin YhaV